MQTLLIIKPDAIKKKYVGKIINLLEENNFNILEIKTTKFNFKNASEFYKEHQEKKFYKELIDFIISDKIIVLFLEKNNAIKNLRLLIGNTNYKNAEKNTIRYKFASSITMNAVHASDSEESFEREKKIIEKNIKHEI